MNLFFITDSRFAKSKDSIYNINGSLCDTLWKRYLEHFDSITVVARVLQDAPPNPNAPQTSDPRVKFVEIPYYVGPYQFLKKRKEVIKVIENSLDFNSAFIARLPSQMGGLVIKQLNKRNIDYAVELVGDPRDSLSYTATHKILPALLSILSGRKLKKLVFESKAALYVTNKTLQNRYPINNNGFSIGVSDVIIDSVVSKEDIRMFPQNGKINLLAIGSLEQMYKSPDIVVKSLKLLVEKGVDAHLVWLGDGKFRKKMIAFAESLGLSQQVDFKGNVSKSEVNNYLRSADIYIQASRTEGLPRALVEAMAVGLPCVGTRVGGIPELIEKDCLIEVNRYDQLANVIIRFINDETFVNKVKICNYNKSLEFNQKDLKYKRDLFFNKVKEIYL